MAVKFPLKMPDGVSVRTMEELREHFDLRAVLSYYSSGRLAEWLEDRYYDEEAGQVRALDASSDTLKEDLCRIFGVAYLEKVDTKINLSDIVKKNERREHLKQYTTDDKILAWVDNVAFSQEELKNLLNKIDSLDVNDEENRIIYLCGEHFLIPGNIGGVIYKGINNPTVEFDDDVIEAGIDLQDLDFNIGDYIDDGNYGTFYSSFDNNLLLGTKLLRQAAEKESVEAQFLLGTCYMTGNGVEEDLGEAIEWYRKAADKGHVDANVAVFAFGYLSLGEEKAKEAIKWYRKAAEQDSIFASVAISKLGQCYIEGIGVAQDFFEAAKWLEKAVEQDEENPQNQYYLGLCYYFGQGANHVNQNYKEAAKWFRKAAELGHAEAQRRLGFCYGDGDGVEENMQEAVKWFRKAAEQGDALAQCRLGLCYETGDGVEEDLQEAAKWYQRAAEQGQEIAQYNLGECYFYGNGVEENFLEAVKWYRRAAEQGYAEAQNSLDERVEDFAEIDEEIVRWYKRAAEQNDAEAQYYLGLCYEEGRGVDQDIDEAIEWYNRAAEQGHAEASTRSTKCAFKGFTNLTQDFADSLESFSENLY